MFKRAKTSYCERLQALSTAPGVNLNPHDASLFLSYFAYKCRQSQGQNQNTAAQQASQTPINYQEVRLRKT